MAATAAEPSLGCSECRRRLCARSAIVDDSYFVFGKPAYLLGDLDTLGCTLTAVEKRTMRSGSYDIQWLTCQCSTALGFVYVRVYDDSFAYKVGKAVVVQSALTTVHPPPPPTPSPAPPKETREASVEAAAGPPLGATAAPPPVSPSPSPQTSPNSPEKAASPAKAATPASTKPGDGSKVSAGKAAGNICSTPPVLSAPAMVTASTPVTQ
eukprot:RCo025136